MASARRVRAEWVVPIATKPIHHGGLAVDGGRIVQVGDAAADAEDLGRVALLPGLVNAHTHLELSYLRGRIAPGRTFPSWVRAVLAARRDGAGVDAAAVAGSARRALADARRTGTALVGDVTNTLAVVPVLREAGAAAHVFYELTGFTEPDPAARVSAARAAIAQAAADGEGDIRVSVAPHAPYSVSAALLAAIRADLDAHPHTVSTVHLGESPEEIEFLREGSGPFRSILEELGRWPDDWEAPGLSPVTYLSEAGFLDSRVLVVHGVQFDGDDLARLRALGVTLVSCPRSNAYVGVGSPPLEAFYAMGVEVAFGTDSLASVADLHLFSELAEARRIAPRVPAAALLRSATEVGARALGFGADFGTLEPGKRAAVLAVRLPEGTTDVEEYLVSGVPPEDVHWVG